MNLATIEIDVTQKHIDEGVLCDSTHCMIAKAITSVFGEVYVLPITGIQFIDQSYLVQMPQRAVDGLLDFEMHTCKPFTFQLEIDLDRFDFPELDKAIKESENIKYQEVINL